MTRAARMDRRTVEAAIRCVDLTSLRGDETEEDVVRLCARAVRPDPDDPSVPSVAAVVVYLSLVPVAVRELDGTGVRVAAAAGGFPEGTAALEDRVDEIRRAVKSGAEEVDTVLDRRPLLAGMEGQVVEEVEAAREASGDAALKVILETGELPSLEVVYRAAFLAMAGGADFLKTSTGKAPRGATLPAATEMMEAAAGRHRETGRRVGVKVSGGIRTADQALPYMEAVERVLGRDRLTPKLFRIGASVLLDDLVSRIGDR